MQEKDIINKYFSPLSANSSGADGLKDDIATLGNIGNGLMAINMDSLVANTHFFPNDDATILAQKALRVNISDLAAKGATPFGYFLSLSLPPSITEAYIKNFARGLAIDQQNYNISLMGGDTVKTTGQLTITITLLGLLEADTVPRRSSAQLGDDIYVTGTIGDGILGLLAHPDYNGADAITSKFSRHLAHYLCPEPRVELQTIITNFAHASMDISDGLLGDLTQILTQSNLGAKIDLDKIPFSQETKLIIENQKPILSKLLTGGDDYEILFTSSPKNRKIIAAHAKNLPFDLTIIGQTTKSLGLKLQNNKPNISPETLNYNHTW